MVSAPGITLVLPCVPLRPRSVRRFGDAQTLPVPPASGCRSAKRELESPELAKAMVASLGIAKRHFDSNSCFENTNHRDDFGGG